MCVLSLRCEEHNYCFYEPIESGNLTKCVYLEENSTISRIDWENTSVRRIWMLHLHITTFIIPTNKLKSVSLTQH